MLRAEYAKIIMEKSAVLEWHKRFIGREDVKNFGKSVCSNSYLFFFFDHKGIAHFEFVKQEQTVSQHSDLGMI